MNHTRCDPESETAADGTVTETAYDAEDHTIATWGATYPVAFAYDRLGRMVSAFVAGISTNAYTYDPETLALSMETQNGVEIERTTDGLGRDTGFSLGADYAVQYAYDAYGRFHSVTSSIESTSSTYTYDYLPDSDLISGMTSSSGFLWTRAYESARSLITSVENRFGETVISRYDYENDELGRRTSRADSGLAFAAQPTYGDSDTVEMPAYNDYSYNTRSEVTGAARRWGTPDTPGDLVLGQQYAYEFDSIGNRITAAEGDASRSASYTANALNQYTQRTVPGVKDLIGTAPTNVAVTINQNPASRQSTYWHHALAVDNSTDAAYPQVAITAVYNPPGTNDPDVVTSQTGRVFVAKTPESFTYDNDGNLTQDGRFTYTWNGENRLISATTRDDLPASVPRVKVEYAYDHQGRRIASGTSIWTNGAWQAAETRAFLYDGWNVIAETIQNPQSQITNHYVWGLDLSGSLQGAGGIGGLLAASLDGSTVAYYHDANGNVMQLVDAIDGTLAAAYEYSPFGETVVSTGPFAKVNTFRFSTKWFDNDTGLGDWGYRWYSPVLGRWPSRDSAEEDGGINLYAFIVNAPIDAIDWLGRCALHLHTGLSKEEMIMAKKIYPASSGGSSYGFFAGALSQYSNYTIKWNIKCGFLWGKLKYDIISPFTPCEGHIYIQDGAPDITLLHELRHFDHYKAWYKKYTALWEKYEEVCMCKPCYFATKEWLPVQAEIYSLERRIKGLDNDIIDYAKIGHSKSKIKTLKDARGIAKTTLASLKIQAATLNATREAECK